MHVCINRLFFGYLCKNRPTTTTRLCHQYRVICAWCTCKVKRKKTVLCHGVGARGQSELQHSRSCVLVQLFRVFGVRDRVGGTFGEGLPERASNVHERKTHRARLAAWRESGERAPCVKMSGACFCFLCNYIYIYIYNTLQRVLPPVGCTCML